MRTITTAPIIPVTVTTVTPAAEPPVAVDTTSSPVAEMQTTATEASEGTTQTAVADEWMEELKLLDPIYNVEREIKSLIEQEFELDEQLEKIRKELRDSKAAKAALLESLPGRLLALRDGDEYTEPAKQVTPKVIEPVSTEWRAKASATVLEGIPRLGKTKLDAIIEQFPTAGDLSDARAKAAESRVHFAEMLPKGVGKGIADEITNRLMSLETDGDAPPCHEVVEPRVTPEAKRAQWIRATRKSIKASHDESSLGENRNETWQDGYDDAHNGNEIFDCPEELTEAHQQEWIRGWLFYSLEHAKKCAAAEVADEIKADAQDSQADASSEVEEADGSTEEYESGGGQAFDVSSLAESIKESGEPLAAKHSAESYGAGFDAAIDEQPLEAIPASLSLDHAADWVRGWLAANDNEGL